MRSNLVISVPTGRDLLSIIIYLSSLHGFPDYAAFVTLLIKSSHKHQSSLEMVKSTRMQPNHL